MRSRAETKPGAGRARIAWWAALAAVMALGFWLRAAHYHAGYGHPDETITVEVVGHMRQSGDWDTNWAKAPNLPADLRYDQYNFSSHLLATFGFYRFVKLLPGTLGWRSEDAGFWVYRFFSVLLATLAVWQTMRLAQRVGGRAVMLGAGMFTAVSTLLVQDAHYARPEAFVTALTLLAVTLCWPRKEFSAGAMMGGAFVIGLLVACKVSMALLAWLPLVPLAVSWRATTARWGWLAAVPLAIAMGFAAGAPGAAAQPKIFMSGVQHLMTHYAGLHPPHSHLNGGAVADLMAAYFAATLGWPVLACGVIGAVALAWRRRWVELALLAGPVALFAGYFATRGVFFERNLSHVVPLFLIVAALGAAEVMREIARRMGLGVAGTVGWAAVGFAALATPAVRVTWPLVQVEFSRAGAKWHEAFESELKAQHPGVTWRETELLNDAPLAELAAHFKRGGGPVLLRVSDYHDEWTAFNLKQLPTRFEARVVADYPGTFPTMPGCTLQTYSSPHHRYFRVTGLRVR